MKKAIGKTAAILCTLLTLVTLCSILCGCEEKKNTYEGATLICLLGDRATVNGETVEEFDYTWHCDPGTAHMDVKNAPAEYYTGTKPETDAAVYIDHELYYFPELPTDGFKLVRYDGENEWAYYYTDGENDSFIFGTLPALGKSVPTDMMHTEAEAAQNKVLHITKAGIYVLEGKWNGQILVDLGDEDETFTDPEAKVTVILNGVDITCTVAPGIVFDDLYECDNGWEERETHGTDVETADAGVTVVIADKTENRVTGTNVFRMLKTKYKDDADGEIPTQKKMRKLDAAFYSYVTMKIEGEKKNSGTLTVTSGFEGIDSELHLALDGGKIVVNSQDDGMNVNEDNVSVIFFNGADITINAALGAEGDGVDSNGYIVVNGGTVRVNGVTAPDSALDSEDGIRYNGGKIIIDGREMTYTPGSTFRETGGMGDRGGERGGMDDGRFPFDYSADFDIKNFKEQVAALGDDATLEDVLALLGWQGGGEDFPGDDRPEMPGEPGERPDFPGGFDPFDGRK